MSLLWREKKPPPKHQLTFNVLNVYTFGINLYGEDRMDTRLLDFWSLLMKYGFKNVHIFTPRFFFFFDRR